MKNLLVLAAAIMLLCASTVHAGKRLTTGQSGSSAGIQCSAVNVSETKTLEVHVAVRNASGVVVSQGDHALGPLTRAVRGVVGAELWCEFIVLSGGSAKDVRASMVVSDPDLSTVAAIEPAREK